MIVFNYYVILDILKLRNIVISLFNLSVSNHKSESFIFHKIKINGLKLNVVIKNFLVIIGIFNENISPYFIKLFLIHMYISFVNFNGDYLDTMKYNLIHNGNVIEYKNKNLL